MELVFANRKLQKLCSEVKRMNADLGMACAAKLQQRLAELTAAERLEDLRFLPGPRCHELSGDRAGQLAVDLKHPRRLVFQPADDPVPRKSDGGLDWSLVTRVLILEIVDYH